MLTKSAKEEEEHLFASSLYPTVRGAITATFYVTVHFYVGCPTAVEISVASPGDAATSLLSLRFLAAGIPYKSRC